MSPEFFLAVCCLLAACRVETSTRSANDVRVVRQEPRCKELGTVEGVGGSEAHARSDARAQAADHGATHVCLDQVHPDLEDGMTFVVTAKMFECQSPDEQFPPDGYR